MGEKYTILGYFSSALNFISEGVGHFLIQEQRLLLTVSSTSRCNAILNQGGRCHETKNAHLLHARTESDYLGRYKQGANIVFISTVYSDADWRFGAYWTSYQLPSAVRTLAVKPLGHAIYTKCAFE